VALDATVTPGDADGFVEFFDGATSLGTRPLDGSAMAHLVASGLAVGKHTLTAVYLGSASYAGSSSDPVSHQVLGISTSVGLAAPTTSFCNQSISLVATVAPAGASGLVEFYDGVLLLASQPLTPSGIVSASIAGLSVGPHSLSASYSGDGCYDGAVSASVAHDVSSVITTLTLSGPSGSTCGQTVPLTATITPSEATGPVQFFDGANLVATFTLTGSGTVTAGIPGLAPGLHSLTAKYLGDPCYLPSTSNKLGHLVDPIVTVTGFTEDLSSTICGDKVTFTASVNPGATGFLSLLDGANSISSLPVPDNGIVVFSITGLSPGVHSMTAAYGGDFCYLPSTSDKLLETVQPLPSTTTVQVLQNPSLCGDKVQVQAIVDPGISAGSVRFFDGADPIGDDAPITFGVAELSITTFAVGKHDLSAHFSGVECYDSSASAVVSLQVDLKTPIMGISVDSPVVKVGTKVIVTAALTTPDASGTVEFFDGATSLGVLPMGPDGFTSLSVAGFGIGYHSLTANYSGDACYAPTTSDKADLNVVADQTPIVHVETPNGGEILFVGTNAKLSWTATDDNGVTSVDLLISVDYGVSFDKIASGIPNTGTYTWLVDRATNTGAVPVYSALFLVKAYDAAANVGSDVSDAPFALYDLTTPTLLSEFIAAPAGDGIELRWRISEPAVFTSTRLERSIGSGGAWTRIVADSKTEGSEQVMLDRTAAPGRAYTYRLIGVTANGEETVLGTTEATTIEVLDFALGRIDPNPSRGVPTHIEYSVAREAHVRLSVLDLQGREVAVLAEGLAHAGHHSVTWNGASDGTAAPGLYFIRYHTPERSVMRRIVVTR
jgi:hypothetical protein